MSEVSVNLDAVIKAITECKNAQSELDAAKGQVINCGKQILASWNDFKSKEFADIIKRCSESFNKPIDELNNCLAALNKIESSIRAYDSLSFSQIAMGAVGMARGVYNVIQALNGNPQSPPNAPIDDDMRAAMAVQARSVAYQYTEYAEQRRADRMIDEMIDSGQFDNSPPTVSAEDIESHTISVDVQSDNGLPDI